MNAEIKLQLPENTYQSLLSKAKSQGVSIEALCLSAILSSGQIELLPTDMYSYQSRKNLKEELDKIAHSDLTNEEKGKRTKLINAYIARFMRK
jgi:hypothetical protein